MKKIPFIILLLNIVFLTYSCNSSSGSFGNSKNQVDELCSCVLRTGITADNILSLESDRDLQRTIEKNFIKEASRMYEIYGEMKDELFELPVAERKNYIKGLIKDALDTKCADMLFDVIPYTLVLKGLDEFEEEIEEELKRMDRNGINFSYGGRKEEKKYERKEGDKSESAEEEYYEEYYEEAPADESEYQETYD